MTVTEHCMWGLQPMRIVVLGSHFAVCKVVLEGKHSAAFCSRSAGRDKLKLSCQAMLMVLYSEAEVVWAFGTVVARTLRMREVQGSFP